MKIDRVYEALGCALAVLRRIDTRALTDDSRIDVAMREVTEAKQSLSIAQAKLGDAIRDRDEGMTTKWCGHRVKAKCTARELNACGCGPAPF